MGRRRHSLQAGYWGKKEELNGERVTSEDQLREAFRQSLFRYQFQGSHVSRVMRCSNPGELEFLVRKFKTGAQLVIQQQ